MPDNILRNTKAAKFLGISNTTLWRLSQTAGFPKKIIITSRAVGFRESELNAWLDAQRQGAEIAAGGEA